MIQSIRQFFGFAKQGRQPAVPAGQRIYAVGDIHGRLDLFEALIEAIEEDDRCAVPAHTTVVLLGDLVDRGPDSAGVIERARQWQQQRNVRILLGNHEEMFLESCRRPEVLRHFLRFGGRETLLSYGIQPSAGADDEIDDVLALIRERVPAQDLEYIRGFESLVMFGDYAFVHAGVLPGVELTKQSVQDLRWIREPFLSCDKPYSHVIIHGHTITEDVEMRSNRIGIDTGAFNSGRLTALVLEGTARRLIQTKIEDGVVSTEARKADA
jgi:serine/threonine protein phosphatase 1